MEENILVKVFKVKDKEYYVVNEIKHNNKHYVCLVNKYDKDDMMIRILLDDVLIPLENETELQEILRLIIK